MWRSVFCSLLGVTLIICMAKEVSLVQDGRSEYVIVVDKEAIPAERTAAKELQIFIRLMSDCTIPIRSGEQVPEGSRRILLGHSQEIRKLMSDIDFRSLSADETVLRTVGDTLVVSGGRPRGTLYAVYSLLEDHFGIHWWTADEAEIPRHRTLSLPVLDSRYAPVLQMRDLSYLGSWRNQDSAFIARLKLNGWNAGVPDDYGSFVPLNGNCHSFYRYIPPRKYGKLHPEWFSGHQLCLSNEAMRKELVKNVLAFLKDLESNGKDISLVSVCQEDARYWCDCPNCREKIKSTGSLTGYLIDFINRVAADVSAVYPQTKVVTFAYDLTLPPDFQGKVNDNVVIHFAPLGTDYGKPLNSEQNETIRSYLAGWKAKAKHLIIWNYMADFHNYLVPHTNSGLLADDIRFFISNHAKGIFEQGSGASSLDDMYRFKRWYVAQLLWNPNQDEQRLRKIFLDGYYGAGGTFIGKYLDYTDALTRQMHERMSCYHFREPAYFTDEVTLRCMGFFQEALKAVRGNKILTERIERDSLPLAMIVVHRWLLDKVSPEELVRKGFEHPAALFEKIKLAAKTYALERAAETKSFKTMVELYEAEKHRLAKPTMPKEFAEKTTVDLQRSSLYGLKVKEVRDQRASDHIAFRIDGKAQGWDVTFPSQGVEKYGDATWDIYIAARAEGQGTEGTALNFGVYSYSSNRNLIADKRISFRALHGKEYQLVHLGTCRFEPHSSLWCGGPGSSGGITAVYVDRILLVKR